MAELDTSKGIKLSDLVKYTDEELIEMGINPDGLVAAKIEALKGRTEVECLQNITILLAGMHQFTERIAAALETIAEAQEAMAFEPNPDEEPEPKPE